MFIGLPDAVQYSDPWQVTLDERIVQLCRGKKRIAYFYSLPDTSTFRYRVFNPSLTLAEADGEVSASWFTLLDLKQDNTFLELCDALVICRAPYNAEIASMVAKVRSRGIPVMFDCDDLVFDVDHVHIVVDSLNKDLSDPNTWHDWFAWIGRVSGTFRLCERFITTNPYLAARAIEASPRITTGVMQNYLNPDQQKLSEALFNIKKSSGFARSSEIHIGYFSGSPSHARDFAVADAALARLMDRDPRVRLRVVGFLDRQGAVMRHADRIEFVPLQDFMNLQRLIAEVEINIAPLHENTFTNCKSELKYFEAAICGTITIATPTYTFSKSVKDGETSLLAPAHGWDEALKRAIEIVDSPDRYAAMAQAAFDHAQDQYGWDRQAAAIIDAVFPQTRRDEAEKSTAKTLDLQPS